MLNQNPENGKYAFASVKETAWHGLGQILPEKMDSVTAIREAQLNWKVIKEPVKFGKGNKVFDGKYVTVRQDTGAPMGIVGDIYEIVQNEEAFIFFDSIVGKGEAIYETAGALYDGRKVFITAKLPGHITVAGKNDLIDKYLFLMTSHDGSGSIIAAFTPIRVVCHNTLNAALEGLKGNNPMNGPVIKLRHTKTVKDRLEEAHKIMGITNQLTNELQSVFQKMAKKKIVEKQLLDLVIVSVGSKEYLNTWYKDNDEVSTRFKNTVNDIMQYAKEHPTQQMLSCEGTVFGAYNAITGYFQNVKNFNDPSDKLTNILDGSVQRKAQKAFDLCLDFIK